MLLWGHVGVLCFAAGQTLPVVQVMSALKQVVSEQNDKTDKLFISSYLDVLLSREYEQPDEDKKQVKHWSEC